MAVNTNNLRSAVEEFATKIQTLKDAIAAARDSGVVQSAIDDIQARVEELGTELDAIIADLQGTGDGTTVPADGETTTQ
jgi:archaellum component FlaC